jgi:hypothetical protein
MAIRRVLLLVPETPAVTDSVRLAMMSASTRITSTAFSMPKGFRVDETFAAVRVHAPGTAPPVAAYKLLHMAPAPTLLSPEGGVCVVRGFVDEIEFDRVERENRLPDGNTRFFSDPEIGLTPTCGSDPPVGTAGDVRRRLGLGRLQRLGMDGDGVAVAVVDNGINLDYLRTRGLSPELDVHLSWSPLRTVRPGQAPVDHGTMCAFDAAIAAPDATLLDFAILQSTRRGGSVMDGILSDAVQAYGVLLNMMLLADDERPFHSLVVSNSWGMFHPSWDFPPGHPGRYADNPNHPFNVIVGSLAAAGADILFAAGNCGPSCPDRRCQGNTRNTITGANSHPDVVTVAGVDTSGAVVGYSSVGPGALTAQKPDLATYTHFLGSEAFGIGEPDSGTSAACPVMAGVVAALRSAVPFDRAKVNRSPAAIKAFLLQRGVRRPAGASTGWAPDDGHGIATTGQFDQAPRLLP